jgi:hypothetical protein
LTVRVVLYALQGGFPRRGAVVFLELPVTLGAGKVVPSPGDRGVEAFEGLASVSQPGPRARRSQVGARRWIVLLGDDLVARSEGLPVAFHAQVVPGQVDQMLRLVIVDDVHRMIPLALKTKLFRRAQGADVACTTVPIDHCQAVRQPVSHRRRHRGRRQAAPSETL